jgi:Kef-type K+ transport system membrane component KefB
VFVAIRLPTFFFPFVVYGPYFIPWLISFVMCVIAALSSCHVNVQLLNRLDLLSVPRMHRLLPLCRLSSK